MAINFRVLRSNGSCFSVSGAHEIATTSGCHLSRRYQIVLLFLTVAVFGVINDVCAQQIFQPLHNQNITQCLSSSTSAELPDFTGELCSQVTFQQVDPQSTMLWLKIPIPDDILVPENGPLGLYLMGKASSKVYLNSVLVGENGKPSAIASEEKVGVMDYLVFLPTEHYKSSENHLILQLSAHQGYLNLRGPMHFIAIAPYADSQVFVQESLYLGLVLLGVFLLSAFYFGNLTIQLENSKDSLLFFIMSLFTSGQLFAELARGIFNYTYPIHDIRLVSVSLMAMGAGLSILAYISRKFGASYRVHSFYSGAIITLISIFLIDSYDAKTTLAIVVPVSVSAVILIARLVQQFSWQSCQYLIILVAFVALVFPTYRYFHEILFYLLLLLLYLFLFARQALDYSRERDALQEERALRAKLELRLTQTSEQAINEVINIESAGKIEKIVINDIVYCQAAGDYVEVYTDARVVLFSGSLKKILDQLPSMFIRVHRSYVVNLNAVSSFKRLGDNGKLLLTNNAEVPVSRRMMPSVRESLTNN